jgi:signal transduction histidine kinase/PAS domain-containing protein
MTTTDGNSNKKLSLLRQHAEQRLRDHAPATASVPQTVDADSLTHELTVYQAELEIQNEELRQAQVELEEARNKYVDLYDFAPTGYVSIDSGHRIMEANLTLAKMLDIPRGELKQQQLRRFVHEADQDAYYFFHRGLFHEQTPQQTQIRLYRRDESALHVQLDGIPVTSKLATVTQARIAISNVSELTQMQDRVERKTDELIITEAALEATSKAHAKVQAEVEQRQRVEAELRFLLNLINAVNAADDFNEALRIVLEAMCIQERRIYGEVWLPDDKGAHLTLSPVFYSKTSQNKAIMQFRQTTEGLMIAPGEGVAGQAWNSGKLIWVEDVSHLPTEGYLRRKAQLVASLHALLAVPITAVNEIVAVLLLYKDVPNRRNERFLALAAAAATQLGMVLQEKRSEMRLQQAHDDLERRVAERTARLYQSNAALEAQIAGWAGAEERLRRRNQELELLHRFSLLISGTLDINQVLQSFATLLQEELDIVSGLVFFYDRERQQIYPQLSWGLAAAEAGAMITWPLTENALFQEAASGEAILPQQLKDIPFFIEQGLVANHPEWQSFVGVPVVVGEEAYGAFGLFRQAPRTFGSDEVTFLKALAQVMRTAVQNAHLFENVTHSREQLRRIARRVFTTQESERQRISRELHDEAGQALTGLKIHLQMVLGTLNQVANNVQTALFDEVREQIGTAVALSQTTLDHIRTLAHDLRPAALSNLGLNAALQAFCRDFARLTQLNINYSSQPAADLPEAVEIGLYRFLQEALTNVARHTQAEMVQVQLQYDRRTISLTVADDGLGFDVSATMSNIQHTGGIGLAGMKERVESVGGHLTITSEPGKGTLLVAWIPL